MRLLTTLLLSLLPGLVLAQEAVTPASAGSPYASVAPMVLIFIVFYFLLIRPQSKKFKEHTEMLKTLKKGDRVVTSGGIIGKIVDADKDGVTSIEIASGVTVQVTKQSINALADAKPAPAAPAKKKTDSLVKNDNVVLKKDQIANDN